MEIDEAITHCKDVSKRCDECGKEHLQLAAWLMELKDLRKKDNMRYMDGIHFAVQEILKNLDLGDSYSALERVTSTRDLCFFAAQEIKSHINDGNEVEHRRLTEKLEEAENLIKEWEGYRTFLAVHGFDRTPAPYSGWMYDGENVVPEKYEISTEAETEGYWVRRDDGWFDYFQCSVCGHKQKEQTARCERCNTRMTGAR